MGLKTIMNTNETTYIFQRTDIPYNKISAYIDNKEVASKNISIFNLLPEEPDYKDPEMTIENFGSFPYGTSADNFILIYKLDEEYVSNFNAEILNNYTKNYLDKVKEFDKKTFPSNVKYFGEDENGNIYTYIKMPKEKAIYNNREKTQNEDGTVTYKVYVKGSAEIIGYHNDTVGNYNLLLSNGYCCDVENILYLFILDKASLVTLTDIDAEKGTARSFYRNNDISTEQIFSSKEIYNNGNYYLYVGSKCPLTEENIKSPTKIVENQDGTLPDSQQVPLLFNSGTIDYLITSDTMKEIEYFANVTNAKKVILSGVTKIGECSFYGSNVSGEIFTYAENLEEIGKYAFAKTPNLDLNSDQDDMTTFPAKVKRIEDYAFKDSMGLDGIDLTLCTNLNFIGIEAFANCANLKKVYYSDFQIALNNNLNTNLLYLPPEQGTGGNYAARSVDDINNNTTVTARYEYNYDADTAFLVTSEERKNSKKTFVNDSNVLWSCQ